MNNIKHLTTLYIIIGLLTLSLFLQRSCTTSGKLPSKEKIIIPAKDGTFVKTKPHEIKYDTIIKDTIIYKNKKIIIDNTDKKIVEEYLKAKDSIAKLNVVLKASKIRKYNEKFDNDDLTLNIEAETTGTLNYIKPTYTIKEKVVSAPVIIKQSVFSMYLGGGLNANLNTLTPEYFVNAGIQNKRGDIISGGFGSNRTVTASYMFRILDIKK